MLEIPIRKIGNSKGIILPAQLLELLNLKEGDKIPIQINNQKITLTLQNKN